LRKLIRIFFAGLLCLAPLASIGAASEPGPAEQAVDKSGENRKLEQISAELEKSRLKIEAEDLNRRKVLSALYSLNQKIRKTVSEKGKMQGERTALEDHIQRLSRRIEELDGRSDKLKTHLAERLKAIHRLGGPSLARILLSASSSAQLDRNLKILGVLAAKDRDVIREYQSVRDEVRLKRTKLAQRANRLKEIEGGLKDREAQFLAEQKMKSRLLDGIRKKKIFALKNLQELKDQAMKDNFTDDAVLDLLFKPSFADEKGRLKQPVDGVLVRRFGIEKSPDHFWSLSHKGLRWATKPGQSVKSVFDGTVAWTGNVPGFGKSIIVDHGDHYYSVYGQAGEIRVQAGQEVQRDQVIAVVGPGGGGEGSGLHFEIRHFSEPEDPQTWMKGTSL
jgi:septal ring factor EnvC (AmiA/AmiB activator)